MVYCVNNLDTTGLCWKQALVLAEPWVVRISLATELVSCGYPKGILHITHSLKLSNKAGLQY